MQSYKTSTLSMMLVYWGASLPLLMIIYSLIGVFVPAGYELISQDKLIVGIFLGAYILFGMQLLSAYLQRSQNNTIPKENKEETQDQDIAELQFISEKYNNDNSNK
jgi:hypothetical protein